ncbi:MAG: S8 family serine peptidase [Pseudomonadota bacterium]
MIWKQSDTRRLILFLAGLLAYSAVSAMVRAPEPEIIERAQITQLIIRYVPGEESAQVSPEVRQQNLIRLVQQQAQLTVRYVRTLASGAMVLALPEPMTLQMAQHYAELIAASDEVRYAEPDKHYRRPMSSQLRTPDDVSFSGDQWYLQTSDQHPAAANLPAAWHLAVGQQDIIVSVLDTGVLEHDDLNDRLMNGRASESGYDFVSDATASNDSDGRDRDPTDPGDWCADSAEPEDSSWHGTHVAGIIGAETNNSQGIAGVDWHARLLTARVLGACGGSLADNLDGIYWSVGKPVDGVTNTTPAHILNMSLGGEGACSRAEQEAIDYAVSRGAVVIVAAGNDNRDVVNDSPGNCENVISVAALDKDGSRAEFSNFGTRIDIAAPGVDMFSTLDTGTQGPVNDNTYKAEEGTSQAAPVVSGVVALMLSSNPRLTDGSVTNVPALIETKLKATARPFLTDTANDCTKNTCGAGMLDAHRAVVAVSTPPTVNTGEDQAVKGNERVSLSARAADDDYSGALSYTWQQTSGPQATLSGATTASPYFTAPNAGGQLVFTVTVTDDTGLSATDSVTITNTAVPQPPPVEENQGGGGSLNGLSLLFGGVVALLMLRSGNYRKKLLYGRI